MKTDRELLELAAKAAGYIIDEYTAEGAWVHVKNAELNSDGEPQIFHWKPRVEAGDALRLAIKLGMTIYQGYRKSIVEAVPNGGQPPIIVKEAYGDDPTAATCLAIFRAAAAIGEAL